MSNTLKALKLLSPYKGWTTRKFLITILPPDMADFVKNRDNFLREGSDVAIHAILCYIAALYENVSSGVREFPNEVARWEHALANPIKHQLSAQSLFGKTMRSCTKITVVLVDKNVAGPIAATIRNQLDKESVGGILLETLCGWCRSNLL